jgi:hypothetical protein
MSKIRMARTILVTRAILAAAACTAGLAGCSNSFVDQGPVNYVFGGGPPPDEPTEIRGLANAPGDYPKLGTVPPRPTDIPSVAQRQSDMDRLAGARQANRAAEQQLRAAGPAPMDVPPPPNLKTPAKSY